MNTEQQIREWAERGWTRADVANALDLPLHKFIDYQHSIGYHWPMCKSIAHRNRERNDRTAAKLEAMSKARQGRLDKLPRYTVFGITGTRRDLVKLFAVVSYTSVHRRMAQGWSIEDAMLTPSTTKRPEWHRGEGNAEPGSDT